MRPPSGLFTRIIMKKTTEISRLLHQIAKQYNAMAADLQAKAGIDMDRIGKYRVVGYLAKNADRDVYQKDIEQELGFSKSAISNAVTFLESEGLIERVLIRTDKRYRKIALTPKGLAFHRQFIGRFDSVGSNMLEGMTREETETLSALLKKVLKNLNKAREEAGL